jgi:TolC family type I secretion outer membrane protein
MRGSISKLLGAVLLASAMVPGAAQADLLRDALGQAYVNNPTLRAARAGQRAVDEQVPENLSGWRPTVTLSDTAGPSLVFNHRGTDSGNKQSPDSLTTSLANKMTLGISQPVFNGFATVEGTAVAEANVKQGQQNLLATEQQVLLNAVIAYMSVYQFRQSVALQRENVRALQGQLSAANERFKVGEITKTDVAQAQAQLSQAKGVLATFQASVITSEATYLQIIGKLPGGTPYPALAPTPKSLDEAYRIAGELNPNILAQAFAEDAAQHNIALKRAPLLPQIALGADVIRTDSVYNYFYPDVFNSSLLFKNSAQHTTEVDVGVAGSVPLYDAGVNYALVRAAKQFASQQRINVIVQARAVRQVVASAWSSLRGFQDKLNFDNDQVRAAQLALDGVKQEYQAGTRTTQDVLIAQQNLVTAQFNTLQDRVSIVLANYQLLNGIGKLTASDMHLNVPLYDPNENYRRVRNKWIGTDVQTVK